MSATDRTPAETQPAILQGTVEVVSFHNEQSLYTVLRVAPERGFDDPESKALFRSARVTAVGPLPDPAAGTRVRLAGFWSEHATHGRQFQFDTAEELDPIGREGLIRYLASKAFEGVGAKLAERIVDTLGERTLEVILERPEELARVPGLRPAVRETLVRVLNENRAQHALFAFLRGAGLGPQQAVAAVRSLGNDVETAVRADPYVLAGVPGLGFKTADHVALKLGFAADGPPRARAALVHALDASLGDGHTFLPREAWIARAAELMGFAPDEVLDFDAAGAAGAADAAGLTGARGAGLAAAARELVQAETVVAEPYRSPAHDLPGAPVVEREAVYLPWAAACERGLARTVADLIASGPARPLADADALAAFEAQSELVLHPRQRAAVLGLLATPIGLLTGGPGVGKTTIVDAVVRLATEAGARVLLASPTGRAAKRLAEATGHEASTIHRLLGFEPASGRFQRDRRTPLEADVVVVDEISMLDVVLAYRLFQAVQPPARLLLIGDPDQLPSVGPGQVLHDLLAAGTVPVWRLTEIYRQRPGSRIALNAHAILQGRMPSFPEPGDLESDFFFFPAEDPERCAELTVDIAVRRIPERFGIDCAEGVQVLAPMYKGPCGVDALNERLRDALGIGGREVQRGEQRWRYGDRVMHTRNDYEKGVFNGDVGRIVDVSADGALRVRYPEQEIDYAPGELGNLTPAFALTVHRSQGGEYPAVVIPLTTRHSLMLQRNLLYTAVTRARRLLVLVGSRRALELAVMNTRASRRHSRLDERLRAAAAPPAATRELGEPNVAPDPPSAGRSRSPSPDAGS